MRVNKTFSKVLLGEEFQWRSSFFIKKDDRYGTGKDNKQLFLFDRGDRVSVEEEEEEETMEDIWLQYMGTSSAAPITPPSSQIDDDDDVYWIP